MNIIKKMSEACAKVRASWKESNRMAETEAIRNAFYLDEKLGTVYLMHNGVAIAEFSSTENISTLTARLEAARMVAIKHHASQKHN